MSDTQTPTPANMQGLPSDPAATPVVAPTVTTTQTTTTVVTSTSSDSALPPSMFVAPLPTSPSFTATPVAAPAPATAPALIGQGMAAAMQSVLPATSLATILANLAPDLKAAITAAVQSHVTGTQSKVAQVVSMVQGTSADVKNAAVAALTAHVSNVVTQAKAVLSAIGADVATIEANPAVATLVKTMETKTPGFISRTEQQGLALLHKAEAQSGVLLTGTENLVKRLDAGGSGNSSTQTVVSALESAPGKVMNIATTDIAAVNSDIASIKADIAAVKAKVNVHPAWAVGAGSGLAAVGGVLGWLVSHFGILTMLTP